MKACRLFLRFGIRQEIAHISTNNKTHCLFSVFLRFIEYTITLTGNIEKINMSCENELKNENDLKM